jgi:hypothetical protein
MTEGTKAQHPPAMKVGGRRLSLSMPRHKAPIEPAVTNATQETEDKKETTVLDYPRPVPLTAVEQAAQQQVHRNEEELPPKKEKKNNHHNDKKVQEYAHRKNETTQPTRDMSRGNKDQKMGLRIGQPASKAFGV